MKIPVVALLSLGLVGASPATGTHPFGTADWQSLRSAGVHAVAPDGRTVLYEVTHGRTTGTDVHEWHTISIDGMGMTTIKLPKSFSPYGFTRSAHELYGSLDVHDISQLAIWTIGAKRALAITAIPSGISAAVLSPDGARYAVIADPRPNDPLDKTRTVVANDLASLYVIDAAGAHGAWWCSALTQLGGLSWSPDATQIATLSQTPKIGYHSVRSRVDVCTDPGAGIAWTAGGKELAFLSTTTDVITPDHLYTVSASGGTPQDRTPDISTSVQALRGDAHGNVWVTIAHGVQTEVHRYRNGTLTPAYVMPNAVIGMPSDLSALRRHGIQRCRCSNDRSRRARMGRPQAPCNVRLERRGFHDIVDRHANRPVSRSH